MSAPKSETEKAKERAYRQARRRIKSQAPADAYSEIEFEWAIAEAFNEGYTHAKEELINNSGEI